MNIHYKQTAEGDIDFEFYGNCSQTTLLAITESAKASNFIKGVEWAIDTGNLVIRGVLHDVYKQNTHTTAEYIAVKLRIAIGHPFNLISSHQP